MIVFGLSQQAVVLIVLQCRRAERGALRHTLDLSADTCARARQVSVGDARAGELTS
jgi:hypothetical protein